MLSLCPFDISVGVVAFVIGLSQISSFFSDLQGGGDYMMGLVPNLLTGDKTPILVPCDCSSGLLQSLDLSALPDGRSIAFCGGCLYINVDILFLSPYMLIFMASPL